MMPMISPSVQPNQSGNTARLSDQSNALQDRAQPSPLTSSCLPRVSDQAFGTTMVAVPAAAALGLACWSSVTITNGDIYNGVLQGASAIIAALGAYSALGCESTPTSSHTSNPVTLDNIESQEPAQ